jgi:hypothetical protein
MGIEVIGSEFAEDSSSLSEFIDSNADLKSPHNIDEDP